MPRYVFDVTCDAVTDREGIELDDLEAARNEAGRLARQSMSERILDGHDPNRRTFIVTDEQGQVVLNFPFKLAIDD